jgi:hypothetical protein
MRRSEQHTFEGCVGNKAPPEVRLASFALMLVKQGPSRLTAGKARHGTLLQSASAPELQAAFPAVYWDGRQWIPLVYCHATRDSGRITGQRRFDPIDASFRRAHAIALVKGHGGLFLKAV